MNRLLLALLLALIVCFALAPCIKAQEALDQLDLLYPQFAHPAADAAGAIKRQDFRFITTDRARTVVPGLEQHTRLEKIYGTKYVRQPFRIFASNSENFSFNLRARAYAEQYNRVLIHYLVAHQNKTRRK